MQQESTSPLVSHSKAKTKVGFVQLGDTAKACKEGRKHVGILKFCFGPRPFKWSVYGSILWKEAQTKIGNTDKKYLEVLYTCLVTLLL